MAPFLNVLCVLFEAEFSVQSKSEVFEAVHYFSCFLVAQDG